MGISIHILSLFFAVIGVVLANSAIADPLPCPEPHPAGYVVADPNTGRDAGGNCNLTRSGPDGKIEELRMFSDHKFRSANVFGKGIDKTSPITKTHDARFATVTVAPGGYSRWHSHPGVNFLFVESGESTYYIQEADGSCTTHTLSKDPSVGSVGTLEIPDQVHVIHNQTNADLVVRVLFLKEESHSSFTFNEPAPTGPGCPTAGYNP